MRAITVRPIDAGWSVSVDGAENSMLFFSGAQAESTARDLGRVFAASGSTAIIEIWLRDGRLAGRIRCTTDVNPLDIAA